MDVTIEAKSATRDVWLWPDYPDHLSDGSRTEDMAPLGKLNELGIVPRFRKHNSGKRLGDLLWTTGDFTKIASRRFVAALTELGAKEFFTFDVEIDHPLIDPASYVGWAVTGQRGVDDVFQIHDYTPYSAVGVSPTLLAALREQGVDAFEVGEFDPWYAVNRDTPDFEDLEDDPLDPIDER